MRRVLVCCPNPQDATSWYRGMGPMTALEKEGMIRLIPHHLGEEVSWWKLKSIDAVFLQRPHSQYGWELVTTAKKMKIPVIVDYDDLTVAMPDSNDTFPIFGGHAAQGWIERYILEADHVWCSTAAIADWAKTKAGGDITVIPNAWDDTVLPPYKPGENKGTTVLWRGSPSHDEDWCSVESHWENLADLPLDWHLWGAPFWQAVRVLKRGNGTVKGERKVPILDYFQNLAMLRPGVVFVPLADNLFNRAKSNCAWIEATRVGAMVIAPKLPEWEQPGIIHYDETNLTAVFETVVNGLYTPSDQASASWRVIEEKFRLTQLNKLRLNSIYG